MCCLHASKLGKPSLHWPHRKTSFSLTGCGLLLLLLLTAASSCAVGGLSSFICRGGKDDKRSVLMIQSVSFISHQRTATSLQRKPAPTMTSHDSCSVLVSNKRYSLYYWVSGFCPSSSIPNRKHFRDWICFHDHM